MSKNTIFVPSDTALADFTSLHENCLSFDFEDSSSIEKIFRGNIEISKKTLASSPTAENAITSLIKMINKVGPAKKRKLSGVVFWVTALIGWVASSLGYFLSAALFKIRS